MYRIVTDHSFSVNHSFLFMREKGEKITIKYKKFLFSFHQCNQRLSISYKISFKAHYLKIQNPYSNTFRNLLDIYSCFCESLYFFFLILPNFFILSHKYINLNYTLLFLNEKNKECIKFIHSKKYFWQNPVNN